MKRIRALRTDTSCLKGPCSKGLGFNSPLAKYLQRTTCLVYWGGGNILAVNEPVFVRNWLQLLGLCKKCFYRFVFGNVLQTESCPRY